MDQFTENRHKNPNYKIHLDATGVKLPDGKISWRVQVSPPGHSSVWWAKVLNDWAKLFLQIGLSKE